jgi:hypothetical protein
VKRLKRYAADISKAARMTGYDSNKLGDHQKGVEVVLQAVETVTSMIREITVEPTGPLSFTGLIERMGAARAAINSAALELGNREREEEEKPRETKEYSYRENPFRSTRFRLRDLEKVLEDAVSTFTYTEELAGSAF